MTSGVLAPTQKKPRHVSTPNPIGASKTSLPNTVSKRQMPKKKTEQWMSYESSLSRHGESDLTYVDSSYKPSFWSSELPRDSQHQYTERQTGPGSTIKPLKVLAAKVVADSCKDLSSHFLKKSLWSQCWSHVWKQMCLQGYDSFQLFLLFVQHFGSERDFRCHHLDSLSEEHYNQRESLIQQNIVGRKHRIENPPESAIPQLLPELRKQTFDHLLLLDLSRVELDQVDLELEVMSLKNLVALDVSGNNKISEGTLSLWKIAMTERWKELKILCIGHRVDATSTGYRSLFRCKNLNYIEGPLISGTPSKWQHGKHVDGVSERFTNKYSLAQKYVFLRKHYHGKRSEKRAVLEFLVGEDGLPRWSRMSTSNASTTRNCYLRASDEATPDDTVNQANRSDSAGPRTKKPRLRKMGLDKYGNLSM